MTEEHERALAERDELARCLLVISEELDKHGLLPRSTRVIREICARFAPGIEARQAEVLPDYPETGL